MHHEGCVGDWWDGLTPAQATTTSQSSRRRLTDPRRPKETDETLVEREAGKGPWLRTGDVAYVKDDAFYICDRIKELIKVRRGPA